MAGRATTWTPPAATLALRLPRRGRTGGDGPGMIDLLVAGPHLSDAQRVTWDDQATGLAEAMRHWIGNEIRLRLRDAAQTAPAHDDELVAAPWWLLAGRRIAGVECNEPAATPTLEAT